MAWTPPSKLCVTISFLLLAAGLFILEELYFTLTGGILPGGILPPLALGMGLTSVQWWGIFGMTLCFLSWVLFYLGVRLRGF